jgi:hypothetical protein
LVVDPSHRWLLIRRNIRTGELAFDRAYSPTPVRLVALVKIAGTRWRIEDSLQSGKELSVPARPQRPIRPPG